MISSFNQATNAASPQEQPYLITVFVYFLHFAILVLIVFVLTPGQGRAAVPNEGV